MKIEKQPLEDHQIKLTVELESEVVEEAKRRAARQLAKQLKIPGFRPGKAPYNVIQRHVGDQALLDEGLELLIEDLYPKILEEADVHPSGPGKLEKVSKTVPVALEFVVPLEPEAQLGDYRSIRFPYELKEISAEEVEQTLQNLRKRGVMDEPVAWPAQEGNRVDFRISAVRTETSEGKNSTLIRERAHSVIIAAEGDPEQDTWPYPAFSRNLIGLSTGDENTIPYTYPEDSPFTSLQNTSVEFKVKIEEVKTHTLPDLNDEFAQTMGEYETLEAMRQGIRETLEAQARQAYHDEYDEQIISRLTDEASVKYSSRSLTSEIENVQRELENHLKSQNLDLQTYLKARGLDKNGLQDEIRPVAEKRLKRTLTLLEVAREENIQLDTEQIQQEAERTLEAMTRFMPESELSKLSPQDLLRYVVNNVVSDMQITKTIERLRAIAKGEWPAAEVISPESEAPLSETDDRTVSEETNVSETVQ